MTLKTSIHFTLFIKLKIIFLKLLNKVFYIYITTNPNRSVLYIGRTDNLLQRMTEHWINRGQPETFAGKYYCYNLIYYEETPYVLNAIHREKQLKGWRRSKKEELIKHSNPELKFLNNEIMEWPPVNPFHRGEFYN
ncbi:GIY-YIG nuclease family protein [Roseivirga sp.]|uniref:GIY-YIG nuclease family protein n=1 Tax=Roseivirga sp. TaxID=1964215 RepID=UPI003B5271A1